MDTGGGEGKTNAGRRFFLRDKSLDLFIFFSVFSLRPRASSSSSQSERSASPLVMNSTQSLDIMPRFAVAAEEEGVKRNTDIRTLSYPLV